MAKYDIQHTCGHVVTHNIVGKIDNRPLEVSRLERRSCEDCYRARIAADAAEANAGLARLVGSEKQVHWAEALRAQAIAAVDKLIADKGLTLSAEQQTIIDRLKNHTDARWWIENRHYAGSAYHMLKLAQELVK